MPRGDERLRTADGKLNQCGKRVKARTQILELTADALCARLDIETDGRWRPTRAHLYKLESQLRIVSDLELLALARVLQTETSDLLTGDEKQT